MPAYKDTISPDFAAKMTSTLVVIFTEALYNYWLAILIEIDSFMSPHKEYHTQTPGTLFTKS